MTPEQIDAMRAYVGHDVAAVECLREFHRRVSPRLSEVITDFYAAIAADPRAEKVMSGGPAQSERLARSLAKWLDAALLSRDDGPTFVASRLRIGHAHVRIELPQDLMFTAMNRIRARLVELVFEHFDTVSEQRATIAALNQLLDIELAVMLESYRENLADRLRTSERLATIGQLAATIGHELRNPLGTIETSVYLLGQRLGRLGVADASIERHVDKARAQVRVCTKTITDLLELARSRPPNRKSTSVTDVIERALELVPLSPAVRVALEVETDLTVFADADQLRQVLVNLIGNAADALVGSGVITIRGQSERGGTRLHVADNGPGISAENAARVFEALFTTKAKGNGLGLPLCRRILEAHGGDISLSSAPSGATFVVWVPGPASSDELKPTS